jgi:hypothetical protein
MEQEENVPTIPEQMDESGDRTCGTLKKLLTPDI